jgi:hypothetical protein
MLMVFPFEHPAVDLVVDEVAMESMNYRIRFAVNNSIVASVSDEPSACQNKKRIALNTIAVRTLASFNDSTSNFADSN